MWAARRKTHSRGRCANLASGLHKTMFMRKKRVLVFVLSIMFFMSLHAPAVASERTAERFDWGPVMEAIIQVESEGNHMAKNGNQVGAMQITPIMVAECNAILKSRGSKKRFKLADRLSIRKSKEMFLLFQSKYNPTNSIEKAIRSWNGGLRYSVRSTQRYFEKVMSFL